MKKKLLLFLIYINSQKDYKAKLYSY